jgi:hypothetical protein
MLLLASAVAEVGRIEGYPRGHASSQTVFHEMDPAGGIK